MEVAATVVAMAVVTSGKKTKMIKIIGTEQGNSDSSRDKGATKEHVQAVHGGQQEWHDQGSDPFSL